MVDDRKSNRVKNTVSRCFTLSSKQNVYVLSVGCGISVAKQQGAQRRIVGGDEAGFGSFPWQVIITNRSNCYNHNHNNHNNNNNNHDGDNDNKTIQR